MLFEYLYQGTTRSSRYCSTSTYCVRTVAASTAVVDLHVDLDLVHLEMCYSNTCTKVLLDLVGTAVLVPTAYVQ